MHLNQAQQEMLVRIQSAALASNHFEVLSAEFEAALDEDDRPADLEKTDPFGVVAIRSAGECAPVEITDAALVIAVSWLEMVASAIAEAGEINPIIFDDDGVSVFNDTRPLFEVATACGIGPAHARRAFSRVRGVDGGAVPRRALKILDAIGAIELPKKRRLPKNRVHALKPAFAKLLGADELARAKAGSIFYTLVVKNGSYEAGRARKVRVRKDGVDGFRLVSEADVDVISDFRLPFKSSEDARQLAVDHFVSFLAEKGYTYQRLVHRPAAA